jgi:hypothetical protein
VHCLTGRWKCEMDCMSSMVGCEKGSIRWRQGWRDSCDSQMQLLIYRAHTDLLCKSDAKRKRIYEV